MSESTSDKEIVPLGRSSAILVARLCFWSPFAACLAFASIASFVLLAGIQHSLLAMWITFAVSGLMLVGGLVLGCVALVRMRRQGANGVIGRAVTGICLDLGLICLLCVADHSAVEDPSQSGIKQPSVGPAPGTEAAMRHTLSGIDKKLAAFEKVEQQKSNGLTLLAGPAIEFLRNEQTSLSNYYVAAKPLVGARLLNMSNVESQDDLERRKALLLQFLDANRAVSNYYQNVESNFRDMATKGGLPNDTVQEQTKSMVTKLNGMSQLPDIWKNNDRWAKTEFRALDLLESNWEDWAYDDSSRKTVFNKENDRTEFNRIVAEINSIEKERTKLQQQLLTNAAAPESRTGQRAQ